MNANSMLCTQLTSGSSGIEVRKGKGAREQLNNLGCPGVSQFGEDIPDEPLPSPEAGGYLCMYLTMY